MVMLIILIMIIKLLNESLYTKERLTESM
jgi:hypothetical protein